MKIGLHLIVMVTVALSACTRMAMQEVQPLPHRAGTGSSLSSVPVSISYQSISKFVNGTDNLTYRFQYLETTKEGALTFQNNEAKLTFSGLKSNQSGTMRIDLLEAGNVKLSGEKTVTLNAGENKIDFVLQPTNPQPNNPNADLNIDIGIKDNPPQSGDLQIDIDIKDGPQDSTPTPTPTPIPQPQQPQPQQPQPQQPQPQQPQPDGDRNQPLPPPSSIPNGSGNHAIEGPTFSQDVANPTFNEHVKKILERHCSECHHAGRPYDFSAYGTQPVPAEIAQKILANIQGGTPKMPPAPRSKVHDMDIRVINTWVQQGLK